MRLRFPLTPLSCLLLLLFANAGSAQDIYVTPIPGAPFTGVIKVERSFIGPNGSTMVLKTMREIGRDSRGRIHNEMRTLVPVSSTEAPQVVRIHLYDPQTRISTMIFAQQRKFSSMTVNQPPLTIPPGFFDASPTGDSVPASQFTKKEDLGVQDIEGLPAHGVRETQTIAGENGGEVEVSDEYWYSNDLRINVTIKHTDPRTGAVVMTITQIDRAEPNPAFFEIPEGYKRLGAERVAAR
jgi:hypothetical protein